MFTKSLMLAGALALLSAGAAHAESATAANATLLRNGPSTHYKIIAHVPGNARISVSDCNGGWCRARFDGESGYIARSMVAFNGNDDTVVTQVTPSTTYVYPDDDYTDDYDGPYVYPGYFPGYYGGYYGGGYHGGDHDHFHGGGFHGGAGFHGGGFHGGGVHGGGGFHGGGAIMRR